MRMLNFRLFQTLAVNLAKVSVALPLRLLIYVSNDAFEPRYTCFLYTIDILPLILFNGKIYVP